MSELRYVDEIPGPDEFRALRERAGMSPRTAEAAARGLPNSLYGVCVRDGERLVGMGRIVGDGGLNFEIVDIAVDPDHQRKGVGVAVMENLMRRLRADAPESAYVSLIADDHSPKLYAKFGFEPVAPQSIGMWTRI
ncbi:MAG: GNAT family N-acetyltransferase [Actinomycetota bacterium]